MAKIKREKFKKLLGYGLVASSALAMTTNAQAAIHYSGEKNLVIDSKHDDINIDLDMDGNVDFRFTYFGSSTYGTDSDSVVYTYIYRGLYIMSYHNQNQFIVSTINDFNNPVRLSKNTSIGSNLANSLSWKNRGAALAFYSISFKEGNYFSKDTNGNFLGERGYIGVRFHTAECNDNNSWNYGWIQFEAAADASSGKIIDWAYEDKCNVSIKAGDTGDKGNSSIDAKSVPLFGGAGLAGLAALLGVAGIAGIRRKEEKN